MALPIKVESGGKVPAMRAEWREEFGKFSGAGNTDLERWKNLAGQGKIFLRLRPSSYYC